MPSWASPGKVWHGMEHMEKVRPLLWRCFCNKFSDEIWALGFEMLAQQAKEKVMAEERAEVQSKNKETAQGKGIR